MAGVVETEETNRERNSQRAKSHKALKSILYDLKKDTRRADVESNVLLTQHGLAQDAGTKGTIKASLTRPARIKL